MADGSLRIALISDTFYSPDAPDRLRARLQEAKHHGAELAVLPELALNPWSPATTTALDDDAELPGGPRFALQQGLARELGIALVGVVLQKINGERYNTTVVFDSTGKHLQTYAKCHLPEETGFWETSHYKPGLEQARPVEGLDMKIGLQICSDNNRPEGTHILAALGAEAVIVPRASELKTYERWKTVFRANALTSCCYVLSVNRPAPEQGVLLGGPSICVSPDGEFLLESTDPVSVVTIERSRITQAKIDYPGYLPVRADLYAGSWAEAMKQ